MAKALFSAGAMVLTFAIFVPYIRSIRQGRTKPHVFSWVVWGLGTLIVFFAQLADRGGLGAWPIGVSGCITSYVALLAYRQRADTEITRADWAFFVAALSALPFWFFTSDPLWAVVILTVVDVIGFGPTLRRAYRHPHAESLAFFALGGVRNLLVLLSLEHFSVTTALFPGVVGLACLLLVGLLVYRRRVADASAEDRLHTGL